MLFAMPLLFLTLFYFYPLSGITSISFKADADGTLTKLFTNPVYRHILWFTVWQAALSTLLTLFFALPGAWLFARCSFPGKRFIEAAMTIPFVMPTVVTAAAFRAMLGGGGLINEFCVHQLGFTAPPIALDHTIFFFLLAHVFYNYSLITRMVSGYWSGLDQRLAAAAQMLGASPRQTFLRVTLPLLMPAIASAALLTFIFCFTSFAIILILGGPAYSTLEVEIYRQTVQLFNLPMAASLSLMQIIFNFALMWVHALLSRRTGVSFFNGTTSVGEHATSLTRRFFIAVNLLFIGVLLLAPLLSLVVSSFSSGSGFTLRYYQALSVGHSSLFYAPPLSAMVNSFAIALTTTLIALPLGMISAEFLAGTQGRAASLWDAIIMLPLATSAVTLGFGFIVTLNHWPLNLRDSFIMLPLAHSLVAFPFVVRSLLPTVRRIPASLRDAAALLGASPFTVFYRIELPLLRPALVVAAVFAFSISMGEFGATAFIARPQLPTLPLAIFRFLSRPGELNYGEAMAMASLLMAAAGSGFILIGLLERRKSNTPKYVTSQKLLKNKTGEGETGDRRKQKAVKQFFSPRRTLRNAKNGKNL